MEWINAKETLPDINIPVLVTYKSATDGNYCSDGIAVNDEYSRWLWWDEGIVEEVVDVEITHWMPLPEPPKEREV